MDTDSTNSGLGIQSGSDWERILKGELIEYKNLPMELKDHFRNNKCVLIEKDLILYNKILLMTKIDRISKEIYTSNGKTITKEDIRRYKNKKIKK